MTALVLSACAPVSGFAAMAEGLWRRPAPVVEPPRRDDTAVVVPADEERPTSPATEEAEMTDRAIKDLVQRLGLDDASAVQVRSVKRVDWPNPGLGCPEPDMMYAQVITPGYLVVLAVAGETYEYHTDTGTRLVLCRDGAPVK